MFLIEYGEWKKWFNIQICKKICSKIKEIQLIFIHLKLLVAVLRQLQVGENVDDNNLAVYWLEDISSLWIWKGVSATLQSGRYTLSYPSRRFVL